ncbi:hypothetical protein HMPREF1548_01828 [Clostridium sp. KLE 1755]|nr:hypothetical protein HMPREF1548_01828 [Clostridium sp. KLE 1755]
MRIHCTNREKTWKKQASAPRRRRLIMGGCNNNSARAEAGLLITRKW